MELQLLVPRPTCKLLPCKFKTSHRRFVPPDREQQVACLDAPRVNLIWVKCSSENSLTFFVNLQTIQSASGVCPELSEPFEFTGVIGVYGSV